jgi:hypothetical protein
MDQLQVQLRRDGCGADVGHVMAHVNHVVAALERERLRQAHAALLRIHHQLHLVAVVQHARAGTDREARVVVRQVGSTHQAGLRQVDAVAALLEQQLVLRLVDAVLELEQFQALDLAAQRVDIDLEHVRRDGDDLALEWRRGARHGGCAGNGADRGRGAGRLALGIDLRHFRGGREHAWPAGGDHPFVPQGDQRNGEDDPQDGAFIDIHWGQSGMVATASGRWGMRRDGIEPARVPRMAAAQAARSQPAALRRAMHMQCFDGVVRAARVETAAGRHQRTDGHLVGAQQP